MNNEDLKFLTKYENTFNNLNEYGLFFIGIKLNELLVKYKDSMYYSRLLDLQIKVSEKYRNHRKESRVLV